MGDEVFVLASELSLVAPLATELDIKDIFTDRGHDNSGIRSQAIPLQSITQRSLLYFDELLPFYVVLQTPYQEQNNLRSFFDRLSISIELRATGSVPRTSSSQKGEQESAPARQEDTIWAGKLIAAEEPVTVSSFRDDEGSGSIVFAIWGVKALLSRPRIRLQSPMITFEASAGLQPRLESIEEAIKDPYLPSGLPMPLNLLEPLSRDKRTGRPPPSLSASRLGPVWPVNEHMSVKPKHLRVRVPGPLPALPAISSRVRYHRSASSANKSSLVASLDMEFAPFSQDDIELTEVAMRLSGGTAVDLGRGIAPKLPLHSKPRDGIVFLYSLQPDTMPTDPGTRTSKTLDVTIKASVLVSKECRPVIQMHWKTAVEFALASNSTIGAPGQTLQRPNRPSNTVGTSSSSAVNNMLLPNRVNPTQPDDTRRQQRAVSASDLGVTISFTAPKTAILHERFTWDVVIHNRSSKLRKLAISAVPKRLNGDGKGEPAKPGSPSANGPKNLDMDIAEAFVDENVLYAMQKSAMTKPSDILSLSATVETGPLSAGACHNTQLSFQALSEGHHRIDAVRVVDLVSKDTFEVRDLPDIVIEGFS